MVSFLKKDHEHREYVESAVAHTATEMSQKRSLKRKAENRLDEARRKEDIILGGCYQDDDGEIYTVISKDELLPKITVEDSRGKQKVLGLSSPLWQNRIKN